MKVILLRQWAKDGVGTRPGMWLGIPNKELMWGVAESLFEMGLSHVDLQTKGFSLEHIFFSDGPISKGREFFKIACHNNVIDIVTC